jgi:hypothetical protein
VLCASALFLSHVLLSHLRRNHALHEHRPWRHGVHGVHRNALVLGKRVHAQSSGKHKTQTERKLMCEFHRKSLDLSFFHKCNDKNLRLENSMFHILDDFVKICE